MLFFVFRLLRPSVEKSVPLSVWTIKLHNRMSSSRHPRAALCQLSVTADKRANLCAARELLEEAKRRGASMAFLPEAFDYIGSGREETLGLSETLAGETMTQYTQMARKLDIWLSLGGFHERGCERRIYNSHIVVNNQGEMVSTYRKCHLFDVELPEKGVLLNESAYTIPGPSLVAPVQTPVGQIGLGICYDLRFPEFSLALQKSGADILTFPSAFTEATGAAHWEVLLRARAIENQCYVLAAAQVGRHHDGRSSYGHALAVDPWGVVMADCGGERAGVALVEVDLDKIRTVRRNMPLRKHRRDATFYTSL
ncbi:deaminated glutathione amidase isoform X1 [Phyllopteryx taeniolatus]|uniref:deaminated glutathione amidase isoform X1 n=1 Tax=Phyllopteryx taeniolatus TaxID=161469 RepID=UPI002AD58FF3|nr:deaminated glutathione amidase isoform X1 [Phyllopteryx taeniolatus]XP_061619642.1 deaminated glutathione amidase isoform X1 [Phyllopteryx taeniolatus]XP_061619643.1 deaminated glutathione amidase isoform X1 [Phyllopteryx taeniolatus]